MRSDLIQRALSAATDTRALTITPGAVAEVPGVFRRQFGQSPAAVIADTHTMEAAGGAVVAALGTAGHPTTGPFVFDDPDLYAEHRFVERLQAWLNTHDGIPIAVGSGTINDLTKLAANRVGRRYMAVATAASMDGYTAFGASITHQGSKQTFDCPAPQAVVADLEVLRHAPPAMNAAGYADLLAKITAGADWIVADALGVEPIDPTAWELVQGPLKASLDDPAGVRAGSLPAIEKLATGLMMGGFAMQWAQTSRPASGAEHQFSHLWDMQHHTHQGQAPSHGFKVAIGTLAVAPLYEWLLEEPMDRLDVDAAVAAWPDADQTEAAISALFPIPELAGKARLETAAKAITPAQLRQQLRLLKQIWPTLRRRLKDHLIPADDLRRRLAAAGAPTEPQQIGISSERLTASFRQAYYIRRRFTVLDLVLRAGLWNRYLNP